MRKCFGRQVWVLVALGACSTSHGIGRDGGYDAGAWDASGAINTEIGRCTGEDEALCGCIAGFRRCDTCEGCPPNYWCNRVQVCRSRELSTFSDGCWFSVDDPHGTYCATGMVCAVPSSLQGTEDSPFLGSCLPLEYCLAVSDADPPLATPVKCVYADGAVLVTGPPPGECPQADEDPRDPFCGGACGRERLCPWYEGDALDWGYGDCVGLSDDRSFGVCAYPRWRCLEDFTVIEVPDGTQFSGNEFALGRCEQAMGGPCACMHTLPTPEASAAEHGFAVLESVCRTYASHHPGLVVCRDAWWNPLP
jgi:hypothetical protein